MATLTQAVMAAKAGSPSSDGTRDFQRGDGALT